MKIAYFPQLCPICTKKDSSFKSIDSTEIILLKRIEALQTGLRKLAASRDRARNRLNVFGDLPLVSKFMNLTAEETKNVGKLKVFERVLKENLDLRKQIEAI